MPITVTAAHLSLETALQSRLGALGVAVVCTGVDGDPDSLWPEERSAVAHAIARRQREFAAGRQAARTAMQRLGHPAQAIPAHPDRSPCWPPGLIGSISHTTSVCIAVVGPQDAWTSIGIDIEAEGGVDESMWESICTTEECQQLRSKPPAQRALFATQVFVAKEAFYKWRYPQRRVLLDFQDVSLQWDRGETHFRAVVHGAERDHPPSSGVGHVFSSGGSVVACCASRIPDSPCLMAEDPLPCNLEKPV
ncbi:4'-phosphopantetheinyl transferase family protein [Hydrogenophaga sp.]|uniref:4'-phosphopantetheinyl transferase family protein n=1 Tax=Hydrogenophaga sp. TaxID=1904254 RepID=UPI003F6FEB68